MDFLKDTHGNLFGRILLYRNGKTGKVEDISLKPFELKPDVLLSLRVNTQLVYLNVDQAREIGEALLYWAEHGKLVLTPDEEDRKAAKAFKIPVITDESLPPGEILIVSHEEAERIKQRKEFLRRMREGWRNDHIMKEMEKLED